MRLKTLYDPKCLELAEHFLSARAEFDTPAAHEENLDELSQQIQLAVEDFFTALEDVHDVE